MGVAEGNGDGEHRSVRHVVAVGGGNGATMHAHDIAAEVEADAGALDVETGSFGTTEEAVEDLSDNLVLQSDAGIHNIEVEIGAVAVDNHVDSATVEGVLHGIGQ